MRTENGATIYGPEDFIPNLKADQLNQALRAGRRAEENERRLNQLLKKKNLTQQDAFKIRALQEMNKDIKFKERVADSVRSKIMGGGGRPTMAADTPAGAGTAEAGGGGRLPIDDIKSTMEAIFGPMTQERPSRYVAPAGATSIRDSFGRDFTSDTGIYMTEQPREGFAGAYSNRGSRKVTQPHPFEQVAPALLPQLIQDIMTPKDDEDPKVTAEKLKVVGDVTKAALERSQMTGEPVNPTEVMGDIMNRLGISGAPGGQPTQPGLPVGTRDLLLRPGDTGFGQNIPLQPSLSGQGTYDMGTRRVSSRLQEAADDLVNQSPEEQKAFMAKLPAAVKAGKISKQDADYLRNLFPGGGGKRRTAKTKKPILTPEEAVKKRETRKKKMSQREEKNAKAAIPSLRRALSKALEKTSNRADIQKTVKKAIRDQGLDPNANAIQKFFLKNKKYLGRGFMSSSPVDETFGEFGM